MACCCYPSISFLSPLLLHWGQEGCRSRSQLSRGDGRVSPWTSGCFVTGFRGETNNCLHSGPTWPLQFRLVSQRGLYLDFGGSNGECFKLEGFGLILPVRMQLCCAVPWLTQSCVSVQQILVDSTYVQCNIFLHVHETTQSNMHQCVIISLRAVKQQASRNIDNTLLRWNTSRSNATKSQAAHVSETWWDH